MSPLPKSKGWSRFFMILSLLVWLVYAAWNIGQRQHDISAEYSEVE